jgi:hypothetical protein
VLEADLHERLDELEAKWIMQLNTVVPNGLNVLSHSREKHRSQTTIQNHYKAIVASVSIRPIRRNGVNALVYVILHLKDDTQQRLCFGQDGSKSFEEAMIDAQAFVKQLECAIRPEDERITQFNDKVITKLRITTASKLIAVYITTSDMTSYKEQIRICFGGKTILHEEAYRQARGFTDMLLMNNSDCLIEDLIQCRQQATTTKGEAPPL